MKWFQLLSQQREFLGSARTIKTNFGQQLLRSVRACTQVIQPQYLHSVQHGYMKNGKELCGDGQYGDGSCSDDVPLFSANTTIYTHETCSQVSL